MDEMLLQWEMLKVWYPLMKSRSVECSTAIPYQDMPQDMQNKVHPGKSPFCALSLG